MDTVTTQFSSSEESPNWLDLPREITLAILGKIGAVDILDHVQLVCTSWNTLCKDPSIWRSIDMLSFPNDLRHADLLTRKAVDRSCGQLIDISIAHFPTDEFIRYLAESSCELRRLQIVSCHDISDDLLKHIASKFPMLEELKIESTPLSIDAVEAVGNCCPQLKIFKCNVSEYMGQQRSHEDLAKMIAKTMPQLHHLELLCTCMCNDDLIAILDSCPRLETLVLCSDNSFYLKVDCLGEPYAARYKKILRYPEEPNDVGWFSDPWIDDDAGSGYDYDSYGEEFEAVDPDDVVIYDNEYVGCWD